MDKRILLLLVFLSVDFVFADCSVQVNGMRVDLVLQKCQDVYGETMCLNEISDGNCIVTVGESLFHVDGCRHYGDLHICPVGANNMRCSVDINGEKVLLSEMQCSTIDGYEVCLEEIVDKNCVLNVNDFLYTIDGCREHESLNMCPVGKESLVDNCGLMIDNDIVFLEGCQEISGYTVCLEDIRQFSCVVNIDEFLYTVDGCRQHEELELCPIRNLTDSNMCNGCIVGSACLAHSSRFMQEDHYFYCNQGSKAPQKPGGSACSEGYECLSGTCLDGLCKKSSVDDSVELPEPEKQPEQPIKDEEPIEPEVIQEPVAESGIFARFISWIKSIF